MNFVSSYVSIIIILIIIAIGWGPSSGAFQVTVLVTSPESEKGSSSAILNTFKGVGGMITPIMGDYFLTNATNMIYSSIVPLLSYSQQQVYYYYLLMCY